MDPRGEAQQEQDSERPRGIIELLALAARMYRLRAREFYATAAVTVGAAWVINLAVRVGTLGGMPFGAIGDPEIPDFLREVGDVFAAGVANGMVYALFNGVAAGALTLAAVAQLEGRSLSVGEALSQAAPRLPALLGATLLFFLALASLIVIAGLGSGLMAAAAAVAGAIGGELVSWAAGLMTALVAILGQLAVILYLALRWALYPQAAVLEGKGPLEALQRSAALTRDPPGALVGRRYLVRAAAVTGALVLLQLAVGALGALPSALAGMLLGERGDLSRVSVLNPAGLPLPVVIPLEILSVLVSAAVLPLGVVCFALLYGEAVGRERRLSAAA